MRRARLQMRRYPAADRRLIPPGHKRINQAVRPAPNEIGIIETHAQPVSLLVGYIDVERETRPSDASSLHRVFDENDLLLDTEPGIRPHLFARFRRILRGHVAGM